MSYFWVHRLGWLSQKRLAAFLVEVLQGSAGKRISEEEGNFSLIPSSTNVVGKFEQLYVNMQVQSVCSQFQVHALLTSALNQQ